MFQALFFNESLKDVIKGNIFPLENVFYWKVFIYLYCPINNNV